MADTKITGLTELTTPVAADVLAIVDDTAGTPVTKKVTMGNLRDNIAVSELADGTEGEIITWDGGGAPTTKALLGVSGSVIQEVYTGSDFDSDSNVSDPDEQSHELNAVSSTYAALAEYVKIKITGTSILFADGVTNVIGNTQLKSQIKETGGAYADIVDYVVIAQRNKATGLETDTRTSTYEIIATLTAGMKANGFQIQVFSKSDESAAGARVRFVNIQTVVELA